MITFGPDNLFDSGPTTFFAEGATLRHASQPREQGATLTPQGQTPRRLRQTGALIADDPDTLRQRINAVAAHCDGQPRELIDPHGRTFPGVVMTRFEPRNLRRLGPRYRVAYSIDYLQPIPHDPY
ncbi:MAG: hypothetical protein GVY27_10230 [Deinococcus-Thermus bacterium]|jgi:hypothetical protein|nr:hypothetical protein [Deinococcota bacterium]